MPVVTDSDSDFEPIAGFVDMNRPPYTLTVDAGYVMEFLKVIYNTQCTGFACSCEQTELLVTDVTVIVLQ